MIKNGVNTQIPKKRKVWPWLVGGFATILLSFGLFYFGILVGSGQLNIGIGQVAVKENKSLPRKLNYDSVDQVYTTLRQKYDGQLSEDKLIEGLKKGLVDAAGDKHTLYFDPAGAKDFKESLTGTFSGIGAELSQDGQYVTILSPIAGFPADKAGLRAKDIITTINGEDAVGMSVDNAVKKIRGDKGTTVKLGIVRGDQKLSFDIVRDTITIPSVETKILDGNIGYIKISHFSDDTSDLINKAAADFKSKNVAGTVLDMRNNPGGYLTAAVDVSCQWLKQGAKVLDEKRGGVVEKTYTCDQTGPLYGVKTVVLINEGSASASEITAGALKDNGAAKLIGTKSYGKGSVQETIDLNTGGLLKVTVARWYTPNGKNIDKEGIQPDIKVELTDENIKNKQDPQLDKATETVKQ